MQHANGVEHGSGSGKESPWNEPQEPLALLIQELRSLTAAILHLAASNAALVDAIAEGEEVEPEVPQGMSRKR